MTRVREAWGPGPWDDEPDEGEWIDATTAYRCAVRRHPIAGHLCGYVCIPEDHPLHGVDKSAPVPEVFLHDVRALNGQPIGKRSIFDVFAHMFTEESRVGILLNVHDSVSYSKQHTAADTYLPPGFWYGFACGSTRDLQPGIVASIRGEIGEDLRERFPMLWQTLHEQEYRTLDYVRAEIIGLAQQLRVLAEVFALMSAEAREATAIALRRAASVEGPEDVS